MTCPRVLQQTHQHRTGPPHSLANIGSGNPPSPPSMSHHCGRGWGYSHLTGERSEVEEREGEPCRLRLSRGGSRVPQPRQLLDQKGKKEFFLPGAGHCSSPALSSERLSSLSPPSSRLAQAPTRVSPEQPGGNRPRKGRGTGLSIMRPGFLPVSGWVTFSSLLSLGPG